MAKYLFPGKKKYETFGGGYADSQILKVLFKILKVLVKILILFKILQVFVKILKVFFFRKFKGFGQNIKGFVQNEHLFFTLKFNVILAEIPSCKLHRKPSSLHPNEINFLSWENLTDQVSCPVSK